MAKIQYPQGIQPNIKPYTASVPTESTSRDTGTYRLLLQDNIIVIDELTKQPSVNIIGAVEKYGKDEATRLLNKVGLSNAESAISEADSFLQENVRLESGEYVPASSYALLTPQEQTQLNELGIAGFNEAQSSSQVAPVATTEAPTNTIRLHTGEYVSLDVWNNLTEEQQGVLNNMGIAGFNAQQSKQAFSVDTTQQPSGNTVKLKTGEYIDYDTFVELTPEQQEQLTEIGIEAFNKQQQADIEAFHASNIELPNGEWVSQELYNSLTPEQQAQLNEVGVTAFNEQQATLVADFQAHNTQLETGEWISTELYESLEPDQQSQLNQTGVEAFNEQQAELALQWESENKQLSNGEWVSFTDYNALSPEQQNQLNELGVQGFMDKQAALQAEFEAANVKLESGDWVDKTFYESLDSAQQTNLNKIGVEAFNQQQRQEVFAQFNTLPQKMQEVIIASGISSEGIDTEWSALSEEDKAKVVQSGYSAVSTEGLTAQEKFDKYIGWGLIPEDSLYAGQSEDGEPTYLSAEAIAELPDTVQDYIRNEGLEAYNELIDPVVLIDTSNVNPNDPMAVIREATDKAREKFDKWKAMGLISSRAIFEGLNTSWGAEALRGILQLSPSLITSGTVEYTTPEAMAAAYSPGAQVVANVPGLGWVTQDWVNNNFGGSVPELNNAVTILQNQGVVITPENIQALSPLNAQPVLHASDYTTQEELTNAVKVFATSQGLPNIYVPPADLSTEPAQVRQAIQSLQSDSLDIVPLVAAMGGNLTQDVLVSKGYDSASIATAVQEAKKYLEANVMLDTGEYIDKTQFESIQEASPELAQVLKAEGFESYANKVEQAFNEKIQPQSDVVAKYNLIGSLYKDINGNPIVKLGNDEYMALDRFAELSSEKQELVLNSGISPNTIVLSDGSSMWREDFTALPSLAQDAVLSNGLNALSTEGLTNEQSFNHLKDLGFFPSHAVYMGIDEQGQVLGGEVDNTQWNQVTSQFLKDAKNVTAYTSNWNTVALTFSLAGINIPEGITAKEYFSTLSEKEQNELISLYPQVLEAAGIATPVRFTELAGVAMSVATEKIKEWANKAAATAPVPFAGTIGKIALGVGITAAQFVAARILIPASIGEILSTGDIQGTGKYLKETGIGFIEYIGETAHGITKLDPWAIGAGLVLAGSMVSVKPVVKDIVKDTGFSSVKIPSTKGKITEEIKPIESKLVDTPLGEQALIIKEQGVTVKELPAIELWSGLQVAGKPIIGKSGGKVVLGKGESPTLRSQELVDNIAQTYGLDTIPVSRINFIKRNITEKNVQGTYSPSTEEMKLANMQDSASIIHELLHNKVIKETDWNYIADRLTEIGNLPKDVLSGKNNKLEWGDKADSLTDAQIEFVEKLNTAINELPVIKYAKKISGDDASGYASDVLQAVQEQSMQVLGRDVSSDIIKLSQEILDSFDTQFVRSLPDVVYDITKGISVPKEYELATGEGGYKPITKLETEILTSRSTLTKLGFSEAQIFQMESSQIIGHKFDAKSGSPPPVLKDMLPGGVKYLTEQGVTTVFNAIKENSKSIKEAYGSRTIEPQMPDYIVDLWKEMGREPADIDIQTKVGEPETITFAQALAEQLKKTEGTENVRIEPNSKLIETRDANGEWHHAVDIHALNESVYGSPTPEGSYGITYEQPAVKVYYPDVGNVYIMKLSETGIRKMIDSGLRWWNPKEYAVKMEKAGFSKKEIEAYIGDKEVVISPAAHRMKDIVDAYIITMAYFGKGAADAWARDYGFDPAKLLKDAIKNPPDLVSWKYNPNQAKSTSINPSVVVFTPYGANYVDTSEIYAATGYPSVPVKAIPATSTATEASKEKTISPVASTSLPSTTLGANSLPTSKPQNNVLPSPVLPSTVLSPSQTSMATRSIKNRLPSTTSASQALPSISSITKIPSTIDSSIPTSTNIASKLLSPTPSSVLPSTPSSLPVSSSISANVSPSVPSPSIPASPIPNSPSPSPSPGSSGYTPSSKSIPPSSFPSKSLPSDVLTENKTSPMLPMLPSSEESKSSEKFPAYYEGAICWQQGKIRQGTELRTVWHVIRKPYTQSDYEPYVSDSPPPGATQISDASKAAETIQNLGGEPPTYLDIDMGIQDVQIRSKGQYGEKPTMKFIYDPEQSSSGSVAIHKSKKYAKAKEAKQRRKAESSFLIW